VRTARGWIPKIGVVAVGALLATTAVAAAGEATPPDEWADTTCSDIVDWAEALNAASQDFDAAETPSEAEDALDGAVADTKALIKQLRQAGTPDVDGGRATARALIAPFKEARQLLQDAAADAADLPDDGDAFDEAKTEIDEGLDETFTALGPDIEAVKSDADAELQDAFDADSSCGEVFTGEAEGDAP
jgi:hypothetical protein